MTDFEMDGPVQPLAKPKRRIPVIDRVLALTGIALAGVSAFFPWYVFFNQDKFGIKVAAIDHTRDLKDTGPRRIFSVSPLAMPNRNLQASLPLPAPFDDITTASISKVGKDLRDANPADKDQPFPGTVNFRLVHVANGRAMIEDKEGMYMVRIGSVLPDQSKLATLEQRGGKWVIVTDRGQVVEGQ